MPSPTLAMKQETLLCVTNFPANTGYAWDFFDQLFARLADHLALHGIRTLVAYPSLPSPPRSLEGSAAEPIQLDASLANVDSVRATAELIRCEAVRVVYLMDRPARSRAYARLRRAGAGRILVYDQTSGDRTRPRGLRRVAKRLLNRVPGATADVIVAVSDYVARRAEEVSLVPRSRIVRVWNGLPVRRPNGASADVMDELGITRSASLVVCTGRATPEKGVAHLLRAFDMIARGAARPNGHALLLYVGAGPQLAELRALRDRLAARDAIVLAGYRSDVPAIIACADICVVPSVWQEAFGLAVLEAMACGKAVVATHVGGIPELIEHDVTGLLVPPADEVALATAIDDLLRDPARRARLGAAAQRRVRVHFQPENQIRQLAALVEVGFGVPCELVREPGQ